MNTIHPSNKVWPIIKNAIFIIILMVVSGGIALTGWVLWDVFN